MMENKFPNWWLEKSWQSTLLSPFSCLYVGLDRLRKYYQQHWESPYKSPIPVIVVGNIMIGGTGKTPMVLYLADICQRIGLPVVIISKGYGGSYTKRYKAPLLVGEWHSAKEVGDEPKMMAATNLAPVVIAYRRAEAIRWVTQQWSNIRCIISDDGLNDYSLLHNMEIVMVDGMRGLGNQRMLPAGPLREPMRRLLSADYTIITKPRGRKSFGIKSHAKMTLQGDVAINMFNHQSQPLSYFADKNPLAIAGIGNPDRFFKHLKPFIPHLKTQSFADHHDYSHTDLPANQPILMTSKDAIKLSDSIADNYWEVPVTAKLPKLFEQQLMAQLQRL